jgi:hypothetical protein
MELDRNPNERKAMNERGYFLLKVRCENPDCGCYKFLEAKDANGDPCGLFYQVLMSDAKKARKEAADRMGMEVIIHRMPSAMHDGLVSDN